jgi:hypothetical protein
MARFQILLTVLAAFIVSASAQFGFFDQMFGGGGQQQQEPQNVRSDASWYQAQYEGGMSCPPLHSSSTLHLHIPWMNANPTHSTVHTLPLPRHPLLRPLPAPLPLRLGECRR